MKLNIRRVIFIAVCLFIVIKSPGRLLNNLGNLSTTSQVISNPHQSVIDNLPRTHYVTGVVAFRQQDYEKAIQHLEHVPPNRQCLAHWFLIQAQNEAGDWLQALDSTNLDVAAERMLYMKMLFDHRDQMSLQEQEARIEVIERYPDMILIYAHRLLSAKQFAEAEAWARLVPDYEQNIGARLIVGRSYFYSGRLAEAETIFHSLYLEHQGENVLYWYGKTLFKSGNQEQGILVMEEAVKVAQGSYVSRYLLGDLGVYYATVGRCSDAQSLIELGLQWNNTPGYIKSIEAIQDRIRSLCTDQN